MSRSLRLHDDAELELNEAADFYDLESPGLGDVFLDDLERAFARISARPRGRRHGGRTDLLARHQLQILELLVRGTAEIYAGIGRDLDAVFVDADKLLNEM